MSVLTSSTRFFCAEQMPGQLAGSGGLAGALQAGQQDHGRRRMAQIEGLRAAAHQRHQFIVDDADQRLARRQAALHIGADRLDLHRFDEALDHGQRHVGLEQRHAHFAQALGDVVFGETAAAAQRVDGLGKPFGQFGEHGAIIAGGSAEHPASARLRSAPRRALRCLPPARAARWPPAPARA